jgi:hypothetical protein
MKTLPASSLNSLNPKTMKERKITTEEINYLHEFCSQRGVEYYDVQMEVVDHFASAIEQRWATNPDMPFDEALRLEYKQFNKYDFNMIIEEREQTLRKKYQRLQWQYIGEFFRLPKIVLTITMTLLLFVSFEYTNQFKKLYYIVILIVSVVLILIATIQIRKTKMNLSVDQSFLLFEEYKRIRSKMMAPISLLYIFSCQSVSIMGKELFLFYTNYSAVKFLISSSIIFFIIFSYITMVYLPQRIKADFTREFPKFVKS